MLAGFSLRYMTLDRPTGRPSVGQMTRGYLLLAMKDANILISVISYKGDVGKRPTFIINQAEFCYGIAWFNCAKK